MTTTTSAVTTPESLCARFGAYVASGDLDGVMSLYAADAVVSLAEGREAAGPVAIRAAFAAAFASGVDLLGGGLESSRAIVVGDVALTAATGADGEVRTQVARRGVDGMWVWIRDARHLSGVLAGPS